MGWSTSRLNDADEGSGGCGLYYKFKHIDKLPEPVSVPMEVGRVIHDMLADYSQHCLRKRVPEDWGKWDTIVEGARGNKVFPELVPIIERIQHSVQIPVPSQGHPWGVEEKLCFTSHNGTWVVAKDWCDSEAWWRAIVDLYYVDEQEHGKVLVVRDWKSQIALPTQREIDNDQQLKRYAYCLSLAYPDVEHFYIELFFVRYGIARSRKLTAEEVQDVPEDIARRVAAVEENLQREGGPRPNVGSKCNWCPYTARCSAFQDANELTPELITDAEAARKAGEAYLLLKRRIKDLEAQLKTWASQEGAINVGDLVLGYADEAKNECLDARGAFRFLVGNLIPEGTSEQECEALLSNLWNTAVSMTPTSAEKAIKAIINPGRDKQLKERVKAIKEQLVQYFHDARKTVFKARKA